MRGKLSRRRLATRRLVLQSLESRNLLAGDCGFQEPEPVSTPFFAESTISAESTVFASDAGSTRSTAYDLGLVSDTSLSGTLGRTDQLDVIKFTVAQPLSITASLSGIGGNLDLGLFDSGGTAIKTSAVFWSSQEQVSASLAEGEYYLAVSSSSRFFSLYSLGIHVQLDQPSPLKIAPPTTTGPQVTTPATPTTTVEALPQVPYFGSAIDVGLNAVNAPEAFAQGYTGQGVTVAVVDSGIDLNHPDLVSSLYVNPGEIPGNNIDDDGNGYVDDVHGYDFVDSDSRPQDTNGHGTNVAGIIAAANNSIGATGVAPDAKILPVRVLDTSGAGSSIDVAAGIRYAADMGAQIINLSLGGGYSRAIEQAIDYAGRLGSLVIAAAGNESSGVPGYPARFSASMSHVLSVGAIDSGSHRASFSNLVGNSGAVQIDAPGVRVTNAYLNGSYATVSGTSQAAPHVSAVAALALQANPDLSPSQLRNLLVGGADQRAGRSDSVGIVNAATTVAYAAAGLTNVGTSEAANSSASSIGNAIYQYGREAAFEGSDTLVPAIRSKSMTIRPADDTSDIAATGRSLRQLTHHESPENRNRTTFIIDDIHSSLAQSDDAFSDNNMQRNRLNATLVDAALTI